MKARLTVVVLVICCAACSQESNENASAVSVSSPTVDAVDSLDVATSNTAMNFVSSVCGGAKEYVHIHDVTLIGPGDTGFSVFGYGKSIYTVPTGKRLIVETISPSASDVEGVNYDVTLRPSDSAGGLNFALETKGVYAAGTIPEKGRDALTVAATLVIGEGVDLVYQMIRDVTESTESAGTSITVVGYLENCP